MNIPTKKKFIKTQDSGLKTQDHRVLRLTSYVLCLASCFLFLALVLCSAAESDSSIRGAFSFSGFATGVGTRAMGMNGAFAAVSDDSSSAYWNPAGLTLSKYKELSFTRADLYDLDLITSNALNISAPEITSGAMSFGWTRLSYDFESWHEDVFLISYAKTILGGNSTRSTRTGRKKQSAFSLSCGATLKYLRQTSKLEISPFGGLGDPDIDAVVSGDDSDTSVASQSEDIPSVFCKSKGMGLDLGVLARIRAKDGRNRFSIGIAVQDAPTVIRWNSGDLETEEYIPYRYKAGCSLEPLPRLTIAFDAVGEENVKLKELHFGVEHWIFPITAAAPGLPISEKNLAIRGGIAKQLSASKRITFAGGLGIRWSSWQLDYAYLMDSSGLGDTRSRFSVSVRF